MMGLLLGILLSRTLAGFVGEHFGWRAVYWMAAGLMVALAAVVGPLLPAQDPPAEISYGELLRSVYTLARTKPVVRQSMLNGALLFACFSAFWATLSFRLETPPLHYGTRVAGLFGVVAAVGALAAPLAGRITDRTGPRVLLTAATASILASFVLFWLTGHTLLGLAAGVILLDVGMQTAQVTNMTRNYAVAASTPSRVNSAYMVAYFVGGSLGSLGATQAWRWAGWSGVCALACGLSAVALFAHLFAEHAGADGVTNLPGATAPSPARA
jgi:predicted MFS family arabinose efflux permease